MGACASAEPFDYEAYFARIKADLSLSFIGKMPLLLVEVPNPATGHEAVRTRYIYVDGPLPEAVMTEFKFKPREGSAYAKAAVGDDCKSPALLVAALIDKHGWTLFSTAGSTATTVFVLQKKAGDP